MELTPVQSLAGWIVFSQRAGRGPDGPIFPPRETLEQIVKHKADRYEEAEAMAKHFLERVMAAPPTTIEDTVTSGLRFVQGLDKKLGGIFGTPPARPPQKLR